MGSNVESEKDEREERVSDNENKEIERFGVKVQERDPEIERERLCVGKGCKRVKE